MKSSQNLSFSVLVVAFCGLVFLFLNNAPRVEAVRAFIVFGDSLVDNGNNNYLATTARADAPPYGIDSPTHRASGRFSNGMNIPDLISQELGSETTLPYLSPQLTGEKLLVGANFASAGVGILDDTGIQFLNIINMGRQLAYFQQYQQRVSALIGEEGAQRLIAEALFMCTLGGNDFVNNYFLVTSSRRSAQFTIDEYVPFILSEYRKILLRIYNLGARRVLVSGTGPMGCVPAMLAQHSVSGECVPQLQRATALFNAQLRKMISGINSELGSDIFIAANAQALHSNFIDSPEAFGFITSNVACCGQGPYNGIGLCTANSNLCPNRDTYVFWDPFHPSEKANKIIIQGIMIGDNKYMHPLNLSTVLALDSMMI